MAFAAQAAARARGRAPAWAGRTRRERRPVVGRCAPTRAADAVRPPDPARRRDAARPRGPARRRCGPVEAPGPDTAAAPPQPAAPWLRQAPLVLIGAALAAIGGAVARGTDGIAAAPAVVAGLRAVSYVGLVLAAGSLAFAALAWPEGLRARRLAVAVWSGWLVTVLATVGQLRPARRVGGPAGGRRAGS